MGFNGWISTKIFVSCLLLFFGHGIQSAWDFGLKQQTHLNNQEFGFIIEELLTNRFIFLIHCLGRIGYTPHWLHQWTCVIIYINPMAHQSILGSNHQPQISCDFQRCSTWFGFLHGNMEPQLFEGYELPKFVSEYIIYNIHYLCIRSMYSEVLLSYSKKHVKKTLDLNTPFII